MDANDLPLFFMRNYLVAVHDGRRMGSGCREPAPRAECQTEAVLWSMSCFRLTRSMSGVLARVLFYPTLAYNVVMERVSSRWWFNRVDQTVILGALPFRSMTQELVNMENVKGVITMNEEYETKFFCNSEAEWRAAGVEQIRLSTVDLTGVPSLEHIHQGVDFVMKHRENGTSVYIHCKAGRSRSATMAAAYLIRIHCWSPEKACSMLAEVRPHILVRSAQLDILKKYHQQVCASGPNCV
uniref:Phosphatidylglycerophosphatase and protein-tyrosine phosphatase 1 n=1 Tax=Astyanax mexicanus TaxID=7994 RepID=A0A3B1ITW8_ASTMX